MARTQRHSLARVLALALTTVAAINLPAQACTNFMLVAADGSPIYARTLEYAMVVPSDVVVVPRGYDYIGIRPNNAQGAKWTSRYAVVGVMSFGEPFLSDGMNEKGLAGGSLYFPGFAEYTAPANANPTALAPWEFLTWILTSFATVEEVKAALTDVQIVDLETPNINFTLPFHFPIHDATGASIVIEPVDGKLKVYDNPLGVLTNSPPFDWHMNNIRNFVNISPVDAAPLKIMGQTFTPFGQGSGLLGLPGDPTPPSRFIRALAYAASAKQMPDGPQAVRQAEHLLNNFDIPTGFVATGGKDDQLEFTQWYSIADLRARIYYIKTHDDQVLRSVDLNTFDLDAKTLLVSPMRAGRAPPALEFEAPK